MRTAVEMVHKGDSIRSASRYACVPESTLRGYLRIHQNCAEDLRLLPLGGNNGRLLTDAQEDALEQFLTQRADLDCCLHELAARQKAQLLAGLDKVPGPKFLRDFLERHPRLSIRCGEMLSNSRRNSFTLENLKDMEEKVRHLAEQYNIREPCQVVVMDETGDDRNKTPARVIGNRKSRGHTMAQGAGEKGEHVTMLVNYSMSPRLARLGMVNVPNRWPFSLARNFPDKKTKNWLSLLAIKSSLPKRRREPL